MRILNMVLVITCLGATTPLAAQSLGLSGQWQRVDPAVVGAAEDLAPAWETLSVDAYSATLQRAAQPALTEAYLTDDVERAVFRVPGQTRTCRAQWNGAALVLTCHQSATGPGGNVPPIDTVETRSLDDAGQLIVDLTWTSGTQSVQRRTAYRRAQ